jgi:hypothetical protein
VSKSHTRAVHLQIIDFTAVLGSFQMSDGRVTFDEFVGHFQVAHKNVESVGTGAAGSKPCIQVMDLM